MGILIVDGSLRCNQCHSNSESGCDLVEVLNDCSQRVGFRLIVMHQVLAKVRQQALAVAQRRLCCVHTCDYFELDTMYECRSRSHGTDMPV